MSCTSDSRTGLLAQCICAISIEDGRLLCTALHEAIAAGAVPFELVVGSPGDTVRPRLGFAPADDDPDGERLARALGVTHHPWGWPDTITTRVKDGAIWAKPFHRRGRWPAEAPAPPAVVESFQVLMASMQGDQLELYLRAPRGTSWAGLSRDVAGLVGQEAPAAVPEPVDDRGTLGVSLAWKAGCLDAITLFADQTALPPDQQIREQWSADLPPVHALAYERAYATARSLGPREGGGWHAFLAWSVDRRGRGWRAASLRLPWQV